MNYPERHVDFGNTKNSVMNVSDFLAEILYPSILH